MCNNERGIQKKTINKTSQLKKIIKGAKQKVKKGKSGTSFWNLYETASNKPTRLFQRHQKYLHTL